MVERVQVPAEVARRRPAQGHWSRAWHRLLGKKVALASLVIIIGIYASGIFAPLVAPYHYSTQDLAQTRRGPSLEHPFGTDRLGRDLLSRVIYGLRTTVIVSVASVVSGALFLGVALGLVSGYFGKRVDSLIMRIGEVSAAFPEILLLILLAATLRPRILDFVRGIEDSLGFRGLVQTGIVDYFVIALAVAVFSWFGMARLVRGQVLSLRSAEFVDAARALGAPTSRILFSHLLPNISGIVIVVITLGLGGAAGSEFILSFLGIGVQPPVPSLGAMVAEGFGIGNLSLLRQYPHLILFPIGVIFMLLFAFNLLGDALADVFNPKTR
ncbi:MAG: ABC transporter permease [Dehalococcoidia bacterium]|nr:ABC transporter permease [Dehalococcoidia bacterium]